MLIEILKQLRGGLIVSCQASEESPLRDSRIMAAMARAAQVGGAVGIRANGPEDISAIRRAVLLPIIGIYKQVIPGYEVYITPTLETASQVVEAGADLLAVDATSRPRPGGLRASDIIRLYKSKFNLPIMADVSTLEEGLSAADAGADLVATTLAGYTDNTRHRSLPDFELVENLVKQSPVPVVVEGHIQTPQEARRALDLGAFAIVVGTAITRPESYHREICRRSESKPMKLRITKIGG